MNTVAGAELDLGSVKVVESELDTLLEKGMTFTVASPLFRRLGKPERTFLIRNTYLGSMLQLSQEWLKLDVSLIELNDDALTGEKPLAFKHAYRCSLILAIAYLNSNWKIKLFGPLLAYYFSRRIEPLKLIQLTMMIDVVSNFGDFITAVYLAAAKPRKTNPA